MRVLSKGSFELGVIIQHDSKTSAHARQAVWSVVGVLSNLTQMFRSVSEVLPAAKTSQEKLAPFIELPAHAPRDSLLHSGSGFDNYRGLYNLALLALVRLRAVLFRF